ncbi:ABC transporter ATP-binding protein [Archaeoglobales archaeon]|nr:MAG: ABC transporter ATP-binding protein [Archaeoglobales archaeon]
MIKDAFGRLERHDVDVIDETLKTVNASYLSNKPFSEMSDGERQKILIARALAQEPEIILMDEPTSFLDAKHKIEVMLLLRKIANEKGVAIVLTTHDIELSLRICDKVILVKNGKIFAKGLPEEILTVKTLETVYGTSSASFEASLGTFELCRENRNVNLHIVCGGGTGVNLMRFLAKKGVGFTAGVIHSNDIDFIVARNTASIVIHEEPYRKIGRDRIKRAIELVEGKVVVDTGFPIGDTNAENLELLKRSSRILSFRSYDELKKLGLDSIRVKSISDVLKEVGK